MEENDIEYFSKNPSHPRDRIKCYNNLKLKEEDREGNKTEYLVEILLIGLNAIIK